MNKVADVGDYENVFHVICGIYGKPFKSALIPVPKLCTWIQLKIRKL